MSPSQSMLAGDFRGPDLAASPESYVHELPGPVRRELARLLPEIAHGNDVEADVQATLADASARTAAALANGHGMILLRGGPVAGHDRSTLATLFTMLGRATAIACLAALRRARRDHAVRAHPMQVWSA